jgi:hypothetical protein
MGSIFIKESNGLMRELDQVRCTSETKEVQDLLDDNLSLIPGDQIKPQDPRRWMMIKREMPIPDPNSGEDRWSLDFVAIDQSAMLTLVECKIHNDTRSRREVVGQVFEYVANAQFYWTADFLKACAEETAQRKRTTLDMMVKGLQPDEDLEIESADDFFEQAISNLKEGIARLIFFLEEAPRELKSIADFLNRQMKRAEVLVVEAKQYSNGQSRIVVPCLFGYTEQARLSKETVRVKPANAQGRRKWNETLFFEDAEAKKLSSQETAAMRALYEFAQSTADVIDWGTGMQRGSFNPKYTLICPRSPFTLFSDGTLQLNFGWINGSDVSTSFRDSMFQAFKDNRAFDLKPDALDKFPAVSSGVWAKSVENIIAVLQELLRKQKETSSSQRLEPIGDQL